MKRPVIEGAPREVATRTPYPFCGSAELGDPSSALGCSRDAVLAGRPAELIDHVYGTEGGAITWLYRFDGQGALVRYSYDAGRWLRQAGTMILGITPTTRDFDPWWGTDKRLF